MMKLIPCGLFWQAAIVIAFRASAKRGYSSGPSPVKLKDVLKSNSGVICGGEDIWRMITVNPAVGSIQNINWLKISKSAEDYIYEQQQMAKGLEGEIKQLQTRIILLKTMELATQPPEEKIRQFIADGLVKFDEEHESADTGLEVASRTGCGHPSKRPRAPRTAYRASPAKFQEAVDEAFPKHNYRLNGTFFAEICAEMLPCKDKACWCVPLCQKFRDIAQKISDDTAGNLGSTGSSELIERVQDLMNTMQHHMSEVDMCRADKENILSFSKHLTQLKNDMDEKFQGVQDAETALDDARWRVVDLEDLLKKESKALQEALEGLEGAGEAFEEAKAALEALQEDETDLQLRLEDTSNSLRDARLEMENIKSAERTVTAIKSAVTTVIGQMLFHLKMEVQDPIRSLGITENFEPGLYFPSDPASLEAAGDVRDAVHELYDYCAGEAKKAFDDVAEELDLSPLCAINREDGEPLSAEDNTQGLVKAIVDRSEHIKKELLELKSWLDPLKGQSLTMEKVQEFLDAGEPAGLRQLFSAYRHTTFYSYLEGWMVGGPLLKLIEELGATIENLEKTITQFEEELSGLESELESAKAKRAEAEEKLQKALEHQKKAGENHTKQEKVLEQLSAQGDELAEGLKDLEAAVRDAKEKYQSAIDKLVESHTEATALLQRFQDSISGFWQDQNRVDREHVASLEAALLEAKAQHQDVELQLRSQLARHSSRSVSRHAP